MQLKEVKIVVGYLYNKVWFRHTFCAIRKSVEKLIQPHKMAVFLLSKGVYTIITYISKSEPALLF